MHSPLLPRWTACAHAAAASLLTSLFVHGAALAAPAPGGSDAPAAMPQAVTLGSMSWGFYDAGAVEAYPNESAQVAEAMKQAINHYNTVAAYGDYVPVTYVTWGGVTAQANYHGSIQFGYMRSARAAQHELSHFMGMQPWVDEGKGSWGSFCNGGWQGPLVSHAWPRSSPVKA